MEADAFESPLLRTALRVVKGAVVSTLSIPTGGTTYAYKYVSATKATLGIKVSSIVRGRKAHASHPPPPTLARRRADAPLKCAPPR